MSYITTEPAQDLFPHSLSLPPVGPVFPQPSRRKANMAAKQYSSANFLMAVGRLLCPVFPLISSRESVGASFHRLQF